MACLSLGQGVLEGQMKERKLQLPERGTLGKKKG